MKSEMERKAPWVQVTAVATENSVPPESSEMERLLADSSPGSSHDVEEDFPNVYKPSVEANTTPSEPQKARVSCFLNCWMRSWMSHWWTRMRNPRRIWKWVRC